MQPIKQTNRWYLLSVLLLAPLLDSCAVTPPGKEEAKPAPAAAQAAYPTDLRGAQLYRLDAKASSVHFLVYRGGTMAKLGHNHVVSATNLSGYLWRGDALEGSGFHIVVPVNDLIVDDDAARKAEGQDFPLNVDDGARQGTKKNMLSEPVLDAGHFPLITIKSVAMSGSMDSPQVTAAVQIRNQTHDVTVPVKLEARENQLAARGEFKVLQTDFGITPFSVAMGTLFVVDSVTIKFDLVAQRAQP